MGQATEQKEKEQRRLVTANRPYLIFMALALTVVGSCGV